ncbi:MAG: FxLYD domain-containing protein [Pseudomonadota bacterium]
MDHWRSSDATVDPEPDAAQAKDTSANAHATTSAATLSEVAARALRNSMARSEESAQAGSEAAQDKPASIFDGSFFRKPEVQEDEDEVEEVGEEDQKEAGDEEEASTASDETLEDDATPAIDPNSDPLADHSYDHDEYTSEPVEEYEDGVSQFEYSPPFTARRNPLKMWTAAAVAFAVFATGTVIAVSYYGLPDWFPVNQPTFGVNQPELVLDFPRDQQRMETLPTGEDIFRVRGTIANTSAEAVAVPSVLVVFVDERGREVGKWPVAPSKSRLEPGETLNVTEAISDIPASATHADLGWAPN